MPRRSARSRGGLSRSVHQIMRRELEVRDNGVSFKPPVDPPSVVTNPFYNLTVVIRKALTNTSIWAVTDKEVTAAIQQQLGIATLFTDSAIGIRIRSVRVWYDVTASEATGVKFPAMKLVAFNFTANGHVLKIVQDFPSGVGFPRVGYRWPVSQSAIVLRAGDKVDEKIFDVYVTGAIDATTTTYLVAYVDLQWSLTSLAVTVSRPCCCHCQPATRAALPSTSSYEDVEEDCLECPK